MDKQQLLTLYIQWLQNPSQNVHHKLYRNCSVSTAGILHTFIDTSRSTGWLKIFTIYISILHSPQYTRLCLMPKASFRMDRLQKIRKITTNGTTNIDISRRKVINDYKLNLLNCLSVISISYRACFKDNGQHQQNLGKKAVTLWPICDKELINYNINTVHELWHKNWSPHA